MFVRKTALAEDSRLHDFFRPGDFLDCYTVRSAAAGAPIQEVAQRLFLGLPCWIRGLLAVRDLGVLPFGLKTTAALPKGGPVTGSGPVTDSSRGEGRRPGEDDGKLAGGDFINFFQVRAVAEDEIILGEDDRHLDFRVAVRRDRDRPERISLATWVRPHNRLGEVYLRTILPFHVLIVTARLGQLARESMPGKPATREPAPRKPATRETAS